LLGEILYMLGCKAAYFQYGNARQKILAEDR